jgi:aminopeptidase N
MGSTRRTIWKQEQPVKMMSFVVARQHHEALLELEGLPAVAVFGSVRGYMSTKDLELIGADVVNSLNFYQKLFDSELGIDRLQVGTIPSSHGQAFEGLLHVGDFTTATDEVARVEMFRAHEVAHQWWGHKVGWESYRDQWLSEGIAQYSAMMFVEQTVKGGSRYFRQMLQAYSDEITGSLGSSGSQFARPGATQLNRRGMDRMGPIGHGYRSSIGETPSAYSSQAYLKGSLVIHMIRVLTRVMTGSDEAFVDVLRSYADRMENDYASTADLQAALTERVPSDWEWFFDQWIYGAEIPTYIWSAKTSNRDGTPILILEVEQRNVSPGFRMPVPVLIQYPGGKATTVLAIVDKERTEFVFELDAKPKKVFFNPDNGVLARVKSK